MLTVTSKSVPRGRVDAGGTRLRLRALHVMGHGSARIARALGVREMTIRQIVRGDARTVSPKLRDARSPSCTTPGGTSAPPPAPAFDRGAATAARKRAIAGNWCAGAALDDDLLDIPGYRPRQGWKPATGTGVAPDVRPRRPPSPEGPPMTSDHRVTPGLIHDILDALERHGYYRSDDLHADRAIGLIGDLAGIYEGTQDHPAATCQITVPPPAYPGPSRHDAITLTRADASTVFAAADIAADDKRYRVEMCPDCPDQSCPDCQTHLRDARGLRPDGRPHAPGRPGRPRRQQPASPGQIAGPSPPPTGRPASDALPPETGRDQPTARLLRPSSLPRGRESGTCRKPPNPTTCRSPTTGRTARST